MSGQREARSGNATHAGTLTLFMPLEFDLGDRQISNEIVGEEKDLLLVVDEAAAEVGEEGQMLLDFNVASH